MKQFNLAQQMCEWEHLDEWRVKIRALLTAGTPGQLSPFLLFALEGMTAQEHQRAADLWMQTRIADATADHPVTPHSPQSATKAKLRLGYLSCDFHQHATALLMVEMLEAHDRERFEIYAYSYGADDGKGMRQRLEITFDRFVDIGAMSDVDAAITIRSDEVDILIDLKGYTANTRTVILAHRPAPIQVNYLGYPGTLGPGVCDYLITDRYLTPPDYQVDYSEAFAYLPDSYQPHGRIGAVAGKPTRAEAGLPDTGFVFCCFNQAYKITPEVFDIWCRLLHDIPDSVLWLLESPMAEGNLRMEAFRRGITASRIIFAADQSHPKHMARLQLADLVLDTFPYNAHTSASDALWVGVPILTCEGSTFSARVAGSLLTAVGLEELITVDTDAYYEQALLLASCSESLAAVKKKLDFNRPNAPLFAVERYTKNLEVLYESMWQNYRGGFEPSILG